MAVTADDETRKHYLRPEVENLIRKFSVDPVNNTCRPLNGDSGWYRRNKGGSVRLRTIGDYQDTINRYRTLYATLDIFELPVAFQSEAWDDDKKAPAKPIGTFRECVAYTLGVDIDGIPPEGQDITTSSETKKAVEDAAQFYVDHLKNAGVEKSVHCLYSGGGIYVLIHHALFRAKDDWTLQERDQAFRSITGTYNLLIAGIEKKFFESHPEHKGRVKFDKLNHQKRKFKVIFSIHKKLPFAVVPLDPHDIKIDFDKARLPLRPEVLAEGANWYNTYDINEKERLQSLLAPFAEVMGEELQQRMDLCGSYDIPRRSEPLPMNAFPPCIKNILEKVEPALGPTRACAVLATYLYQVGWIEVEAFDLWMPVAERARVETRIFAEWYGQMSCPSCKTLQREDTGYPNLGLGGLGYCESDEKCKDCKWPGGYGISPSQSTLEDAILFLAGRCDNARTADGAGFNKKDTAFGHELADKIASGMKLTPDESGRARKMLRKYKKQLALGDIDYEDIAKSHVEILPPIPSDICGIEGGYARKILLDPEKVNVKQLILWHVEDILISNPLNQMVFDTSNQGEPYLWFMVEDHYELMCIVSSRFADLLARRVLDDSRNEKCLSVASSIIKDLLPSIRAIGKTITEKKGLPIETELTPRIKHVDNAIWYDIGRKDWQGVKITTEGVSIEPLPIGFIRRNSMLEQAEPDLNATASDALKLKDYFPRSLSSENALLCMVWLVSGFIGSMSGTKIPKVHILISGPHGSAKSTILDLMVSLLDPDTDPLKKMPTTQKDAAALLRGYNVVILDNIGRIEPWLSDTLCQASTGGASTDRELYSNFDIVTARYNARVGMTSLGISRMEPDLVERMLLIITNAMPSKCYNSLTDIHQRFKLDKPMILGGLFKTVVETLKILPDVLSESKTWSDKPRMLDFCVIGEACSRVWGNEPGHFKKIYNISLRSQATDLLNEVEVLQYLQALVDKNLGKWSGLTSGLLDELNDLYKGGDNAVELPDRWPRHAGSLGRMISKYSADLLKSVVYFLD